MYIPMHIHSHTKYCFFKLWDIINETKEKNTNG